MSERWGTGGEVGWGWGGCERGLWRRADSASNWKHAPIAPSWWFTAVQALPNESEKGVEAGGLWELRVGGREAKGFLFLW